VVAVGGGARADGCCSRRAVPLRNVFGLIDARHASAGARPSAETPELGPQRARVPAASQTPEEAVGLFSSQAAFSHGGVEDRRCVPETDVEDGAVELARLGGCPQPLAFLVGDPAGLDHPVEAVEETFGCPAVGRTLMCSIHKSRRYRDIVSLSIHCVSVLVVAYTVTVPKLWSETIETHRREVRDAILDTTAALLAEQGLRAVTMSQIAEDTGIGRATLYKYFPDVEAILMAWHERHVTGHLDQLVKLRDQAGGAGEAVTAVLEAYALIAHEISHQHHGADLSALVHQAQHVARAQDQLSHFIQGLLADAAKTGDVRDDVAPSELTSYCLHALAAASSLPSKTAVRRLVMVTLAGLRTARNDRSPAHR
jgi:AcrR family transcriptional regulator